MYYKCFKRKTLVSGKQSTTILTLINNTTNFVSLWKFKVYSFTFFVTCLNVYLSDDSQCHEQCLAKVNCIKLPTSLLNFLFLKNIMSVLFLFLFHLCRLSCFFRTLMIIMQFKSWHIYVFFLPMANVIFRRAL